MVSEIILFIILSVLSLGMFFNGVIMYQDHDPAGVLGIVAGVIGFFFAIVIIVSAIFADKERNKEKTEKIVGRGTITETNEIDYVDGGGINSDKVTFYFLLENGDKIIVDKKEWESDKTEFTYKDTEANKIKE